MISIIILNNNDPFTTIQSIRSILKYSKQVPFEIILVENGSKDDSLERFRKVFSKKTSVRIVHSQTNRGFGGGHNFGSQHATGEYLFFLNNDIAFYENSLPILLREYKTLAKTHQLGFLQPRLFINDKRTKIQITCSQVPSLFQIVQENLPPLQRVRSKAYTTFRYSSWNRRTSRFVDAVCGAAMFCHRRIFEKIGGFDERFKIYFEEYDLAKRGRLLGLKNYFTTATSVIHLHGKWPAPYWYKKWIYVNSFVKYITKDYETDKSKSKMQKAKVQIKSQN